MPTKQHHKTAGEKIPLYQVSELGQEYYAAGEKVTIFQGVNLKIQAGDSLALSGVSGSGKSSLLHILGTLANASYGTVLFQGRDLARLSMGEKARLRNNEIGFVFQHHYMLPEFSALENVAMPGLIKGMPRQKALQEAAALLHSVGLSHREKYNVTLLSGGERQRTAIARAVLNKPGVLLADEPTGSLDEKNGGKIIDLLLQFNETHKMAMVVATHNRDFAARMARRLELKSGVLYEQTS